MMNIKPKDLWTTLSPALRRQVVDDLAGVLAEVDHEIGARHTKPSGAQSGGLYPPVDTAPDREQSGEPAVAVLNRAGFPGGRFV
jgi:hypothetical protein